MKNAGPIGLVVLVAIAAASLATDAKPEWSSFLRTRARGTWSLIAPRFAVNAVAGVVAFVAGALAAWYETVLIGGVSIRAMFLGILCAAIYLRSSSPSWLSPLGSHGARSARSGWRWSYWCCCPRSARCQRSSP